MTQLTDERKAFEAHITRKFDTPDVGPFSAEEMFYRPDGARYFKGWLESQWQGWQDRAILAASRASAGVEKDHKVHLTSAPSEGRRHEGRGYTAEGLKGLIHERMAAAHLSGMEREGFPASGVKFLQYYVDQLAASLDTTSPDEPAGAIAPPPTYTHEQVRSMLDGISADARSLGLEVVGHLNGRLGLRAAAPAPSAVVSDVLVQGGAASPDVCKGCGAIEAYGEKHFHKCAAQPCAAGPGGAE